LQPASTRRQKGRTNRLQSFDMRRTAYKTTPPIICCLGKVFTELLPSNDRDIHRQTHRHMRPTILTFFRAFVAGGACLPSLCLAMKRWIHIQRDIGSTPLLSNETVDTHTERYRKYAVKTGSGAKIYCTYRLSGIQKLTRGIHRHIESTVMSYAYFHFFFKIRKVGYQDIFFKANLTYRERVFIASLRILCRNP
jgi:hypothetical protein